MSSVSSSSASYLSPTITAQASPQPQQKAKRESTPKTRNERYHPPPGLLPFECNLCGDRFTSLYGVKRHFDRVCLKQHKYRVPNARWPDHPSCLTRKAALAHPCARPFFPTYQVYNTITGERTLSWPALSGWPTSPAELERKNAAHLATPGANPHFVDMRENVYADVVGDAEEFVAGEDPVSQLEFFIQVVDADAVGFLRRLVEEDAWQHGWGDDVLFGVALHRPDGEVVELLGCEVEVVKRWFEQAEVSIFREHVRVCRGSLDGMHERVLVEEQEERWRKAVAEFRARHCKVGSGEEWKRLRCCDGVRIDEAFAEAREAS